MQIRKSCTDRVSTRLRVAAELEGDVGCGVGSCGLSVQGGLCRGCLTCADGFGLYREQVGVKIVH